MRFCAILRVRCVCVQVCVCVFVCVWTVLKNNYTKRSSLVSSIWVINPSLRHLWAPITHLQVSCSHCYTYIRFMFRWSLYVRTLLRNKWIVTFPGSVSLCNCLHSVLKSRDIKLFFFVVIRLDRHRQIWFVLMLFLAYFLTILLLTLSKNSSCRSLTFLVFSLVFILTCILLSCTNIHKRVSLDFNLQSDYAQ